MITILTRSPKIFSFERIKYEIVRLKGDQRGPKAVLESLRRGLTEIGTDFQINPPSYKIHGVVHVLSGVDALLWAIEQKKMNRISKIIVGPNLVISPDEEDKIIQDPAIDLILQPSQWPIDFISKEAPEISEKMRIWPAGVHLPTLYNIKNPENHDTFSTKCLIYKKSIPKDIYSAVLEGLDQKFIEHKTITYGAFKTDDFYDELEKSHFMVYLSASESQGIALQEAWARNVPTLVWGNTIWKYKNHSWSNPILSAPYLNAKTGMFFKDAFDFQVKLKTFIENIPEFQPRKYVEDHLSDEKSAKLYMNIINTISV